MVGGVWNVQALSAISYNQAFEDISFKFTRPSSHPWASGYIQ